MTKEAAFIPRRICILSPCAYPLFDEHCTVQKIGGAELQLTLLARELADRGYQVNLIVDEFGQSQTVTFESIVLHKVALKYMGGSNFYLLPSWVKLISTLFRINADIHILKVPRSLLLPLGIYCRLRNRKLLFVGQTDTDINLEFLRKHEGLIPYWFYRLGMINVSATIAQNQLQADGFSKVFHKPASLIRSAVSAPETNLDVKKSIVLWVGRNLQNKRPEYFAGLAKKLPQHQFVMIMAPEPNQSDAQYRKLEQELNNFEYKGFLPFHETQKYFLRAKILVSTSDREGFPNVFLQAWQANCPVVSLTVDPDGVIKKYSIGKVSGNLDAMAADIDSLMTDDKLRKQMAKNGMAYIEEHHAISSVVDKYENVFQSES